MATLSTIFTYPVKSFPGIAHQRVALNAGEGLPDDRRYAITNGITNTNDGAWLTCRSFFINAVNDGLLKYANESDADTITLAAPNGFRISWRKGDAESLKFANSKMPEFIASLQPAGDLPTPQITERTQSPGMLSGYWDFNDSGISVMNASSLKAIATAMGETLDIRRLRGNLILEDLPPWEEFSWVGKSIRLGQKEFGPQFDILRPAKRCPATSVNPQTGMRDLKVPDALVERFGHGFCGIYAKVIKPGEIQQGDQIEIIGEAKTPLGEAANPAAPDYKLWPKITEIVASKMIGDGAEISIRSAGNWPLPEAKSGQRMRLHIGQDLIGIAQVLSHSDHTTVLHIDPSKINDPATAYLLEKVKTGDKLIVSGPFGRG